MAIIGTHTILYTSEPDALRALLRDAFGFPWVDAHGGWLIFGLPPAEMGVHPAAATPPGAAPPAAGMRHEIAFMCDDLAATMAGLAAKGVRFEGTPDTQSYGHCITMLLPGAVRVMLYQPTHKTMLPAASPGAARPEVK